MVASGVVDIEAHAARSHQEITPALGADRHRAVDGHSALSTRRPGSESESRIEPGALELRTAPRPSRPTRRRPLGFLLALRRDSMSSPSRRAARRVSRPFTLNKRMADPGCRMRFHIPEQEDEALALLTPQPERSAELYPPPVEPQLEPIPVRSSPQAVTREPVRPLLPMALAGGGALIVWGLFYVLLFRHDPE